MKGFKFRLATLKRVREIEYDEALKKVTAQEEVLEREKSVLKSIMEKKEQNEVTFF